MKNKTYTRIASKIEKLENKRTADINKCKDIIAENEAKIQEADTYITVNTDIDEFLTASENKAKAESAIKACNDKIHLLETKGMVSEEEYQNDVKDIRSEQQKVVDETFNAIVPLMKQLFKLYGDMEEKVKMFNDLIKDDADIAKHDLGVGKFVMYTNDDKYNLLTGFVGRLQYQMEHHLTLSDYFKKN